MHRLVDPSTVWWTDKHIATPTRIPLAGTFVPIDGQMRQKAADLFLTHVDRMPLVVEQDEPADPTDVLLLGTERQMQRAATMPHLVNPCPLAS